VIVGTETAVPRRKRIAADFGREYERVLKKELEIKLAELEDKWHYTSLEKIFFEEKIYKELEKKHETWDKVLEQSTRHLALSRNC
jgi:topoisomerase-4 subunit A